MKGMSEGTKEELKELGESFPARRDEVMTLIGVMHNIDLFKAVVEDNLIVWNRVLEIIEPDWIDYIAEGGEG